MTRLGSDHTQDPVVHRSSRRKRCSTCSSIWCTASGSNEDGVGSHLVIRAVDACVDGPPPASLRLALAGGSGGNGQLGLQGQQGMHLMISHLQQLVAVAYG